MVNPEQTVKTQHIIAPKPDDARLMAEVASLHDPVTVEILPNGTMEERAIATQAIHAQAQAQERLLQEYGQEPIPGGDPKTQAESARHLQENGGHVVRISAAGDKPADASNAMADFWQGLGDSRRN